MYCQRCGGKTEQNLVEDRLRPVCTACQFVTYLDPKLAVAVVISEGECILLGKRGANTRNPGTWSFPAGFVERGEVIERAAEREVREETGLLIDLGGLLGLFSHDGEPVALAAYAASGFTGIPQASDDLEQLKWFPLDALPELSFSHDDAIINAWKMWRSSVASNKQRSGHS